MLNAKPILPYVCPAMNTAFAKHVDRSDIRGCWLWTGDCRARKGYGRFRFCGDRWRAHRVAYVLSRRAEIPNGMLVVHRCDNPRCVNPRHLSLGTITTNKIEEVGAGRHVRGERVGSAKLDAHQVQQIITLKAEGKRQHEIAAIIGVSRATVGDVLTGRAWAHVTGRARKRTRSLKTITLADARRATAMRDAGCSQVVVGKALGLSRATVRDIERGHAIIAEASNA